MTASGSSGRWWALHFSDEGVRVAALDRLRRLEGLDHYHPKTLTGWRKPTRNLCPHVSPPCHIGKGIRLRPALRLLPLDQEVGVRILPRSLGKPRRRGFLLSGMETGTTVSRPAALSAVA